MTIEVTVQDGREEKDDEVPPPGDFSRWVKHAAGSIIDHGQVTVRIVDAAESQQLNKTYRSKDCPTNVLSFPYGPDDLPGLPDELRVLGDLVICADIVRQEAHDKHCPENSHWAHLTIHGMLHLMGYDHVEEQQAKEMESLEITLLGQLNISNPYEVRI